MFSSDEEYFLFLANRLLEGTLTAEERIVLDDLLRADENKRQLIAFLESEQEERQDVEAEIIYEKSKPIEFVAGRESIVHPFSSRKKIKIISIAASILMVCGSLIFWTVKTAKEQKVDSEWQTIATGKGERKSIKLSDGSEVWLNNESTLRLKNGFGKTDRILQLIGEGYFSIAKNPNLPLTIKTAHAEVMVLGTKFNLRAIPDENITTTSLIEGKVRLKVVENKQIKTYELLPGNKISVINAVVAPNHHRNKNAAAVQPQQVAFEKLDMVDTEVTETLWMKNRLVLKGDDFNVVARKMERWFGKPVVIKTERLAEQHVTGIFEETTSEEFLDMIKRTGIKLNYYTLNDTLYVK